MKFFIFVLMFLIISSLIIVNNNDLNIYDSSDFSEFSEIYFNWAGGVYLNLQNLTGDAIRMAWVPE